MTVTSADMLAAAALTAGICGAIYRRRLPAGLGMSLFVIGVSVATGVLAFRFRWPLSGELRLLIRVCAALSTVWAVSGWATRISEHDAPGTASGPLSATSACFFGGALVTGLLAAGLIIYRLVVSAMDRLLNDASGQFVLDRSGATDILALVAALTYWRLTHRERLQPAMTLLLGAMIVAWVSLMIPGGVLTGPERLLPVTQGFAPAWWTWTLNLHVGLAVLLVVAGAVRHRVYVRHRSSAWPDRLERLLDPYPTWMGFKELFAVLSAVVLVTGVYHVVHPFNLSPLAPLVSSSASLAAGVTCLLAASRRWSDNVAGLGLSLVAVAAVSLPTVFVRADAADEYSRYLPQQLNAAMFGLAFMAFLYLWLSGFWRQQLLDGEQAWTVAGRTAPHAYRVGFVCAAIGVLCAFNMALWPLTRIAVSADNSAGRWAAGLAALAGLSWVTGRFAQRRNDSALAMLCVAAVGAAVLFAFVRWPTSDTRGWFVQYASVCVALAALPALALAEWLARKPGNVFAPPLWFTALLLLPMIALYNLTAPSAEWLRPMTYTILAAVYALAAEREGRRLFMILAAALFVVALASLFMTYRGLIFRRA